MECPSEPEEVGLTAGQEDLLARACEQIAADLKGVHFPSEERVSEVMSDHLTNDATVNGEIVLWIEETLLLMATAKRAYESKERRKRFAFRVCLVVAIVGAIFIIIVWAAQ